MTPQRPGRAWHAPSGFTLIELMLVVAIIGIVAAIALPALLSARRSGNHASALASLRAIDSAQRTFSSSCAYGAFAMVLTQLGLPPGNGGAPFISDDLAAADRVSKSGYIVRLAPGGDGRAGQREACNGVAAADLSSTYYATAEPETPGGTGTAYYWIGTGGTIFEDVAPIAETNGLAQAPGGRPIQ